jgi:hypothetical protein
MRASADVAKTGIDMAVQAEALHSIVQGRPDLVMGPQLQRSADQIMQDIDSKKGVLDAIRRKCRLPVGAGLAEDLSVIGPESDDNVIDISIKRDNDTD